MKKLILVALILIVIVAGGALLLFGGGGPRPGSVKDEALTAGRDASTFVAADEDYFHDMDGAVTLTAGEIKGRNTWDVWTGGNQAMWGKLTANNGGPLGFPKILP